MTRVVEVHEVSRLAGGDERLERFVLEDEGRHDRELVQLFYRRNFRYLMLCGPAGSAIARRPIRIG